MLGAGRSLARPSVRPLIGVTTSEVRLADQVGQTSEGEPPRTEMALGLTYLEAIERAGGLPVVIPPLPPAAVGPLLDNVTGICLSGGPDLHPDAYGRKPHSKLGPTWRDLDIAELAVARAALSRELPVLAICRGAQALNVARSGTLFQHLPERFGSQIEHRQENYGPRPAHPVDLDPASRLASIAGATRLEVNSYHHQAIEVLGRGLRPVGWSPDGVVEAIELPRAEFVVGVQWHAEAMAEAGPSARLFEAFVGAAERYGLRPVSVAA